LHNEEIHNLYSLPNTVRIIWSGRMRWAGHAACMGEKRNAYRVLFLWKNQKESDHYKNPEECGRIILK
jgi:hypothetical protein